jgi:UDP-N-acetylglucosamine--N-acetylmuramyl-(pentapeptide) pyrophosphoryl-undecaprenol N-acetylglucosamine transferase
MEKCSRIAVFAGPSGGHLFPALAFSGAFREKVPASQIALITGEKGKRFVLQSKTEIFDQIHYLPDFPFPRQISLQSMNFLLQLGRAFIFSSHFLSQTRPDLCVGFGSYMSYPGLAMASRKKIPILIHEQNRIPGKATLWLAPHADCVTVSFQETLSHKPLRCREFTGLPLRSELQKAALQNSRKGYAEPFRLLIVGGSQGAHRLNETVVESFSRFSHEEKSKIAVMHITGETDFPWVKECYQKMNIQAEIFPFWNKMETLYSHADVAITRAGANTLFELALFRLPAIVIPYPYAGGHQQANANYYATRDAVISCSEFLLTSDWLLGQLRAIQKDSDRRKRMSEAIGKLATPDAACRLVNLAEGLLMKDKSWILSTAI